MASFANKNILKKDASSISSSSTLLKGALLFIVADILFSSFGTAFVYANFKIIGVLFFMIGWQICSTIAYVLNVYNFGKQADLAFKSYKAGILGLLLTLILCGVLLWSPFQNLIGPDYVKKSALFVLLVFGGTFRGIAFSSRTWLELNHTKGAIREKYLFKAESIGTVLKVLLPILSATILKLSQDDFGVLFVTTGSACTLSVLILLRGTLNTTTAKPQAPWGLLTKKSYWNTAPFYILDGASHALRTALFVSGAMAAVGSAAAFGVVEACASLTAASLLWWQANHPKQEPSLAKLRISQILLAFGWGSLIGALKYAWLLPFFIVSYAISHPFITVIKSGLTLKGLAQTQACPQDNLIARMLLLTLGRLSALGMALCLVQFSYGLVAQLIAVCFLALMVLPLEYLYAKRLSGAGA